MITCTLEVSDNINDLQKIFLSENLETNRAKCTISKDKTLKFSIVAKDPVSMKAFVNSILKVIETYNKISRVK
jgi:tRNA threonylcarbamoyladenosine modification (KEOPS) complex  Pcc1 subunit